MTMDGGAGDGGLDLQLERLARVPTLLVASDYDGTLAPIVNDPSQASPLRESMVALCALSELKNTHVAVISGRALSDLAGLTRLPPGVHLVGSHGSEFDVGFARSIAEQSRLLLATVGRELEEIASLHPGFHIERKPASIALHYRNAGDVDEAELIDRVVKRGPGRHAGVHPKLGKKVIELTVVDTNKGKALQTVRRRVGASAAVFFGDDVTDEDVFVHLCGPDIGVKVGPEESAAQYRVGDPEAVARCLARLLELREAWLAGAESVPINHHAMLGDLRTIALVEPDATISYLCVPRIDSSAMFCSLLGGPGAGFFSVRPEDGAAPVGQEYVGDSLVVRTRYPTFTVTDFLDCTGGRTFQRAGRTDLVRIIEGSGRAVIEFAPRLDFGRMATEITQREGGLQLLSRFAPIVLRCPGIDWTIESDAQHQSARAVVELGDEPVSLVLRYGVGTMRAAQSPPLARCRETQQFWESWVGRLQLPDVASEAVKRSALTLRGLIYGPTGAIAAAGTTSLPEELGGVRNWDYRFCWPRDASIAALALTKLNSQSEAMAFLDWMLGVLEHTQSFGQLHPIYTVTGDELNSEGEIGELAGYAGSRPVRIGNAAAQQVQLDVFGPVVELIYELALRDAPLTPAHWHLVEAMVGAVDVRWREPDHGIWEVRGRRSHHVHSKVMCWFTVDRALKISLLMRDKEPEGWASLRDSILQEILERGWKEHIGAFTSTYEGDDIDSACLLVGLTGMLPPDDPRVRGTIDAVERELLDGSGVFRYRYDDRLPGFEGTFLLSTSWLILSRVLVGRHDAARELFDAYLTQAGPTGLLTEEYDFDRSTSLGNYPQAYSHAGLIECALALARQAKA